MRRHEKERGTRGQQRHYSVCNLLQARKRTRKTKYCKLVFNHTAGSPNKYETITKYALKHSRPLVAC